MEKIYLLLLIYRGKNIFNIHKYFICLFYNDYKQDELHYRVEFNGLIPSPDNTSGVFKLVKENNRYRVIEYNGDHG